jgi:thioredoxin 1
MIEVESLEDLKKVLAEGKPVVLKFYASWCAPCKKIAPLFGELRSKYPELNFVAADADSAEEIVSKYEITGLPSTALFDFEGLSTVIKGADESAIKTAIAELASLVDL